jgi:hypothetical protein
MMRQFSAFLAIVLLSSVSSSANYPVIVAKIRLMNQTGGIPQTTIFTPPKSGLFRISAVGCTTVKNSDENGIWGISTQYIPVKNSFPQINEFDLASYQLGCESISVLAWDIGGLPLQYLVESFGTNGAKYDLFITVEQLE